MGGCDGCERVVDMMVVTEWVDVMVVSGWLLVFDS